MRRRVLLRLFAVAATWARIPLPVFAQPQHALGATDEARVRALAEAVLPIDLTPTGRAEVVDAFVRWIRNYREGAEMDHGYGFTRLRKTPASPAAKYPAQLAALDQASRARGAAFDALDLAARRVVVAAAIDSAKVERLPVRPTGDHIATDLMGFYFHGEAANDLAYRAAIRRDSCRGLPGSESIPNRLGTTSERVQGRVRTDSEPVQNGLRIKPESVQSRFRTGSESVQSRLRTGSESVRSRTRTGSESVPSQVADRRTFDGRGR
jgi:hypothetical protein